ncbi:MAG: hypothetical protein ACOH2N_16850 [Devosia sp.]
MPIWSSSDEYLPQTNVSPTQLHDLLACWNQLAKLSLPLLDDLLDVSGRLGLSNMALVQMLPSDGTARYRVVGRNLVRLLGKDPTGAKIDQVYQGSILHDVCAALNLVSLNLEPTYYSRRFQILHLIFGYRRLLLPIRRLSGTTEILVAIYPEQGLSVARDWKTALSTSEQIALADEERRWADVQ